MSDSHKEPNSFYSSLAQSEDGPMRDCAFHMITLLAALSRLGIDRRLRLEAGPIRIFYDDIEQIGCQIVQREPDQIVGNITSDGTLYTVTVSPLDPPWPTARVQAIVESADDVVRFLQHFGVLPVVDRI